MGDLLSLSLSLFSLLFSTGDGDSFSSGGAEGGDLNDGEWPQRM
jgi:hypothetical protein